MNNKISKNIAWFNAKPSTKSSTEIDLSSNEVGGKGLSLTKMTLAGLPVPSGFTVTTNAFESFLEKSTLKHSILDKIQGQDLNDNPKLEQIADEIKDLIMSADIPTELADEIVTSYESLAKDTDSFVAVRSSAGAEDGAEASFAGQQDTFLNVKGSAEVLEKVKACWASFFGGRAIFYRSQKGSLEDTSMAVVVQRMVVPDKSGVMFTVDPIMKNKAQMMVEAAWGLGEAVVSGIVTPDNYLVNRSDKSIARKLVAPKAIMMTRDETHGGVIEVELPEEKMREQVLSDDELKRLVDLGELLEQYFGLPQDVEWSIEAETIYLLQSRPITSL